MWAEGVSVFTEAPTKKEMLKKIFTHPDKEATQNYITGRFG